MIKKRTSLLIILAVVLSLAFLNYSQNSHLIGWDNLMPEFSSVNITRSLKTVWQEYQSLGLLGGMAHAADLPRQVAVWCLTRVNIPSNFIRYLSTFAMLLLGSFGMFFLARGTVLRKFDTKTRNFGALFASLFYLLNLSTIQAFYTPFETFLYFYGFLSWLLIANLHYLSHPHRKTAFVLAVIHLLAAPAFYVQTMFVVYGLILVPIHLYFILKNFHARQLVTSILATLIIFVSSAYWLLPAAYFTLNSSKTTTTSAQNQIATPEVTARNREYGSLQQVFLLKGFWFDYVDTNDSNEFDHLMSPWIKHYENPTVTIIALTNLVIIILGVFFSYKKRLVFKNLILSITLLSLFFLINQNPPTGQIFEFLQSNIPLLRDFFRSVFTKWSIVTSLCFSLYFAIGCIAILDFFTALTEQLATKITTFTLFLFLIIVAAPAFQGHLISNSMRQTLPSEYPQLFEYFKTKDTSTRIANMPQHTFWGWYQTDWGYRGSGFLWYGIEQPIMDRAFDVWSKTSQDYYFEIRHAIYSQNLSLLEALLEKYSVNWLLVDKSVIVPGITNQKSLYLDELKSMISQSQKIKLDKSIGFLDIYSVSLDTKPNKFVDTLSYNPKPVSLTLSGDVLPQSITTNAADLPSLDPTPKNCDSFNSTAFDRIYTGDEVTYTATNAMSCDHLIFDDLPHSFGYNFILTHKNAGGQPFLVCIEAHSSGQCEYFGYLPNADDWTDTTLTINRLKPGERGFTVHLYSYSIGQIPTSNSLKQIKIDPAWPPLPATKANSTLPYAKVESITKHDYTYYDVALEPSSTPQIITLNQAFHTGWKAYSFTGTPNLPAPLKYLFTLAGLPLRETSHIQNKGWENSWVVPAGTKHLTIIFVPQIVQYIGFSLLLLIIPLIFVHKTKKAPEEGR